jgi:thiol-disulfide isomerase/thioredoxin
MALRKLLGVDHVVGPQKKEIAVESLEGKITMLYFSAHWCPPCRQFTPVLSKLYKSMKAEKKDFEIIFISSDKSQEEFDEYVKEHPWPALPWSQRKVKDKLSRKMKVSSIPALVILNKEGQVVSSKGRQHVMQDPDGKDFPWVPKAVWDILHNAKLTFNDGRTLVADDLKKCDAIGLYFSAHWCAPCRAFTPRLASVYRKLKERGTNFEIVFVSIDQAVEEFAEYFSEMPWAAMQIGDARIQELADSIGVEGIPTLVTIKPDGTIINKEAKEVADEDEDAAQFPWAAISLPPICPLNPSQAVVQALNNDICVVLSLNGAPNRTTAQVEFGKAVERLTAEVNAKLEPEDRIRFLTVDDTDDSHVMLYKKVLSAMGAAIPKHGEATVLMMNLPNKRVCKFVPGELSAENIVRFVTEFKKSQEDD